jgi:hypothetical protein
VVARSDDALDGLAVTEEVRVDLTEHGLRRIETRAEVERDRERYDARAAASNSSRSGTSPGS